MNWVSKIRPKNSEDMRFHKSIAFIIILGQAFALMPLHGVTGASVRSIYFTWKSWKVFYTVLVITGCMFCSYTTFVGAIRQEDNLSVISSTFFYAISVIDRILFLLLAKNWSLLMKKWCSVDLGMRSYGYPAHLNARLRIFSAVLFVFAAVEHALVVAKSVRSVFLCRSDDFFKSFFAWIVHPSIIQPWTGWIIEILTTISTFSWTYIDLFIILLSTSLAVRFKQVANHVESYVYSMVFDIALWRNAREDYNRLSQLCKALNESLCYIIIVSFGSNLFFILVQFFYSLKPIGDTSDKIYFFYSFGLLIGRTMCVSLYGAWIHDESQRPIACLNSVPSSIYNVEIRRFILHAGIEPISLTGKRFFNVTRSIILSIAGTLVTYELVLIQVHGTKLQAKYLNNSTCGS